MSDETLPGLAAARLWAAARFPYLASGLFGAQVVQAPDSGAVTVDENWRLHADPEVTAEWTAAQFGSVLVHHACHLLRSHGERARAAGVRPEEAGGWVRAADSEINDDLVPAGLELPGDPVLPHHLGAEPGGLAEQYFETVRHAERTARGEGADCGSGAHGFPADSGDVAAGTDDRPRSRGEEPARGLSRWQAELLRRLVARDCVRHGREAGAVPAGLMRWAAATLDPRVDWRTLLAAELRRAVAETAGAADYSYRRPSRRAVAAGDVVLPALRRPVPDVAVVCDTSGSMTDDLLAAALAEVDGLLRSLGLGRQVRVLACDTSVGPAQRVSSARQVELVGGGGTDMGAGIAAVAALRPRPAVTVVLTDGHTPWPAAAPKGTRVVVGLLGDAAPDAPGWARTVRIPAGSLPDRPAPGRPAAPCLPVTGGQWCAGQAMDERATDRPETGRQATGQQPAADRSRTDQAGDVRQRPAAAASNELLMTVALLLTACSAAADVASFTRLGNVFVSVMTSNIVFLGLAAARRSVALAVHAAISFLGYVVGVAGGSRIAGTPHWTPASERRGRGAWPGRITVALLTELGLFVVFTAGWEATGGAPAGTVQLFLLAVATTAMGVQSATVRALRLADVSTTYMTGTLTALVAAVVSPGPQDSPGRRFAVLVALAVGAGLSGLLLAAAPPAVPAIAVAALAAVLVLGTGRGRRKHHGADGR